MIFFLVTKKNRFTIDRYLSSWGKSVFKFIQPLDYEDFLLRKKFLPGTYIFSDIELLTETQRNESAIIFKTLRNLKKNVRLLNHPTYSLRRYDLLKMLHEKSINQFNVYRIDEDIQTIQYPVFLRIENDHGGTRSKLLNNREEMNKEIEHMINQGISKDELLIVEFRDTSDQDRIYRKYAAFILDGIIVPRHVFFSRSWHQKYDDILNENYLREEMKYLHENPHQEQLRNIFRMANLHYGRIDYSLLDGKIQVWEINSNPTILSPLTSKKSPRVVIHESFNKHFLKTWKDFQLKSKKRGPNYLFEKSKARYSLIKARWNCYKFVNDINHTIDAVKSWILKKYPKAKSLKSYFGKSDKVSTKT